MNNREAEILRRLRAEAEAAGDDLLAADCLAALAGDVDARLRCHEVIEAAAAMDDGS